MSETFNMIPYMDIQYYIYTVFSALITNSETISTVDNISQKNASTSGIKLGELESIIRRTDYSILRSERNKRQTRQSRRDKIVKCCVDQSCSSGTMESYYRRQDEKQKEQEEADHVSELQYKKARTRKRKKQKGSPTFDLDRLHAYGVFTEQGLHISCAGCPSGWPDMLTIYPDYENGIPITCSNCPRNWPGALNLLGVGGDPSWAQGGGGGWPIGGTTAGNNFLAFDAGSNFGGGIAGPGENVGLADGKDYEEDVGDSGGGESKEINIESTSEAESTEKIDVLTTEVDTSIQTETVAAQEDQNEDNDNEEE